MSTDQLGPVVDRRDRHALFPLASSAAAVMLIAVGSSIVASASITAIGHGPVLPPVYPTPYPPVAPASPGSDATAGERLITVKLDLDADGRKDAVSLAFHETGGRAPSGFTVGVDLRTGTATAPGPSGWPPTVLPRVELPGQQGAVLGLSQAGAGTDNPSFYVVDGSRLHRLYTVDTAPLRAGVEGVADGWQVLGYGVFDGALYSWRVRRTAAGAAVGAAESWSWAVRGLMLESRPADCHVTADAVTC